MKLYTPTRGRLQKCLTSATVSQSSHVLTFQTTHLKHRRVCPRTSHFNALHRSYQTKPFHPSTSQLQNIRSSNHLSALWQCSEIGQSSSIPCADFCKTSGCSRSFSSSCSGSRTPRSPRFPRSPKLTNDFSQLKTTLCAPFPFWPVVHVLYKYSFILLRYSYRFVPERFRRRISNFFMRRVPRWKLYAFLSTLWAIGWFGYFSNIQEVPLSHRRRFIYVPNHQLYEQNMSELSAALDAAQQTNSLLPDTHILHKRVTRVVEDIECLAKDMGLIGEDFNFKVFVIDSNESNAFALPFGQVIVYTPMITDSDDELAILLGHEMAHVFARHASEQLSRSSVFLWLDSIFFMILSIIFPDNLTFGLQEFVRLQIMHLFTELPMSRMCEKEADYIGLVLAARAGYNPKVGVKMWQSMLKEQGNDLPQWFTTHPTHDNRANDIKEWIPQIIKQTSQHAVI